MRLSKSVNRASIGLEEPPEPEDTVKYGRYWLWGEFIDDNMCTKLEQAVEEIRHINIAVQQDIEDNYITEGLVPQFDSLKDRNENQEVMKEARKFIQKLKEEDNKLD